MDERKVPGAADLAVLDPDGSFVCRLRHDRDALARLACGLWTTAEDARRARLAEIEELAHRLAGAAGTFGYERVGMAALELENDVATADRLHDRSAIEASLARLRMTLENSLRKV
ncbi:MAG TPA: Hpt domain-containing protein [Dongiaceae bacterium]|jgi:HPt (histidine-containing phosphotransfer) domain-containing protein